MSPPGGCLLGLRLCIIVWIFLWLTVWSDCHALVKTSASASKATEVLNAVQRSSGAIDKKLIPSITPNGGELSRRTHKNKYGSFSKQVEDPLVQAIKHADNVVRQAKSDAIISGTTVPLVHGSNNVNIAAAHPIAETVDLTKLIPSDPITFGYLEVGRILGAHGIKGEVKIQFETDFADYRVQNNSVLFIKKPTRRTPRPITVMSGRKMNDNTYLVFFEGVKSRLSASLLQKYSVFVKVDDRPNLGKEEYLLRDLIGLKCYIVGQAAESKVMKEFNAVVEGVVPPDELCDPAVRQFMHSMLEIRVRGTKQHCLVPFVPSIVPEVNLVDRYLLLNPPAGLLDLTYEVDTKVIIRGSLPARIEWLSDAERDVIMRNSIRLFPEGGLVVEEW